MAKKFDRHILTVGLMASSITLLVLLQIFWLRNSYNKAYYDLQRETNIVFRGTLLSMWDSLIATTIIPIPADSLGKTATVHTDRKDNSVAIATIERNVVKRDAKDSARMKVIFSTHDSMLSRDVLKPLALRMKTMSGDPNAGSRTFVIRLDSDTLDMKRVSEKIRLAFDESGIDIPFQIHQMHREGPRPDDPMHFHPGLMLRQKRTPMREDDVSDTILSESVSLGPLAEYSVSLENIRPFLLGRIGAEIFFSIVLTSLTASAFLLMYKNIKSQQRLVSAKNDFINNVTHELKTPVATVSVALEALQNFNSTNDTRLTKEYLEIAQRELIRLNEITDRILNTSVLEHQSAAQIQDHDLSEITERVLSDMKIILDQKNARVAYAKEGSRFNVHCDSYQLYQVVENLLDNALKYSHADPVIELSIEETTKEVILRIKDHGVGIPGEYHQKIFDKFFRVPTGDVHSTRGYGLGLSYVNQVVRSVGGDIHVDSADAKGTTFTLRFPRSKGS